MKRLRNCALKRQEKESGFAAFQFIAAFTFSQLLEFPYNFLMVLIPLLVFEGVLIVFYLRKLNRKNQPTNLSPKETQGLTTPKPKPKVQGIPVTKVEISNDSVKFSVEKGLLKKRCVTVKEIPVAEITVVEGGGNELTIIWKGVTYSFLHKKKGESFSKLRDQMQGLLDEQQNKIKAQLRKSDLAEVIKGSIGVVDLSFDILMGLQAKRVNWEGLEAYANELGENFIFAGKTLALLSLDLSSLTDSIKSQVPENVSQETFNLLKSIYGYFDELNLEEDMQETHPNSVDAKAVILAYYTLNDILLGEIVGEKTHMKESMMLETALQNLAKETNFNVNFEDLRGSFDKMGSVDDVKGVIEESREIFKEQLKNIDRPNEQLLTAQPPTEQAIAQQESLIPPIPLEPLPPSEPQAPMELQTLELVVEQPKATQSPIEPSLIEQPESVLQPKPLEPIEPAKPQELAAQPSTEQPSVQRQEPAQAEVALPESENEKNTVEPPPKKKSAGQRLRKSILGY